VPKLTSLLPFNERVNMLPTYRLMCWLNSLTPRRRHETGGGKEKLWARKKKKKRKTTNAEEGPFPGISSWTLVLDLFIDAQRTGSRGEKTEGGG